VIVKNGASRTENARVTSPGARTLVRYKSLPTRESLRVRSPKRTQHAHSRTSGSLHRTHQDKGPHMLPVITVKLPFIIQFHPHHLRITSFFPSRSQNIWDHKIGLVQYQLKGLLNQEKIWSKTNDKKKKNKMVNTLYPYNGRVDEAPSP
jgi:hypothetical protein